MAPTRLFIALMATIVASLAVTGSAQAFRVSRLLAPESVCPGQSDTTASTTSQERSVLCMTNFARKKSHRKALRPQATLAESSLAKSKDIIRCDAFSHEACGRDFLYWMKRLGYVQDGSCWAAGENIGWATGELATPRGIMRSWLLSPGHRENILSRKFSQLGVGMDVGSLDGHSDGHVFVQHFGSHC